MFLMSSVCICNVESTKYIYKKKIALDSVAKLLTGCVVYSVQYNLHSTVGEEATLPTSLPLNIC